MEITYDTAKFMLQKRLEEFPEVKNIVSGPEFKGELENILNYTGISLSYLPIIENELMVILAFYAPLHKLADNISETTGLPLDTCDKLVTLIKTLLLRPVEEELYTFQSIWKQEEKEAREKMISSGKSPSRPSEASVETESSLETPPEWFYKNPPTPNVPPAPKEIREELTLRPAGAPPRVPPPPPPIPPPTGGDRPLTREEVLRAITPKRTMATDIESVRKEQEGKQVPFTDMR